MLIQHSLQNIYNCGREDIFIICKNQSILSSADRMIVCYLCNHIILYFETKTLRQWQSGSITFEYIMISCL